jgi:hypothetical protein
MKRILTAIAAASVLAGCGSFGHTLYEVSGNAAKGYDLKAADGKQFKSRKITFDAKVGTLLVEEGESEAFRGQALGVKALNILPTTGLGDILAPRAE